MTKSIMITLNGAPHQIEKGETSQSLLNRFKQNPDHIMIEHNATIYKGTQWECSIQDGDTIEIIQFMGGG